MKTIAILGDSYSTFEGFIPKGYASWYNDYGNALQNDVEKVEDTWWYPLLSKYNLKMLINSSYGGSTVCNSGYDGDDYSSISFMARAKNDLDNKIHPDVIILFGGTNDFWVPAPCGPLLFENWKKQDLYQFAPAYCFLLDYLKRTHSNSTIINVINDDITGEIRKKMKEASNIYNIQNVELKNISKENGHPNKLGMLQIREQLCNEAFDRLKPDKEKYIY